MSDMRLRTSKRRRSETGLTTAPESRCAPGLELLSMTATGTSPSRSATAGASSSSCPSRIAHASPAGPAPTIRTPTSMGSGSLGSATTSAVSNGGGYSDGLTSPLPCAHELGELRDDLVDVADDAEVA